MVRWLMQVRKKGRWGNTQENAWAMEALVDYYRKYESDVPDFAATVSLGTRDAREGAFKGRSTDVAARSSSRWQQLLAQGAPGTHCAGLHARGHGHAVLHAAPALRRAT